MATATALSRRLTKLERQRRVASQPSDSSPVILQPPSAAYARTVLRKLYDIIAPIRDAGGHLTPRMQDVLRLVSASST